MLTRSECQCAQLPQNAVVRSLTGVTQSRAVTVACRTSAACAKAERIPATPRPRNRETALLTIPLLTRISSEFVLQEVSNGWFSANDSDRRLSRILHHGDVHFLGWQ